MTVSSDSLSQVQAPIIGVKRHCLSTDGHGVTTLVGFYGCPLHCKYCLNPQCHASSVRKYISPDELYRLAKVDALYFMATRGGICFGGGEPCLHSVFIHRFKEICDKSWKITLETSLYVPQQIIEELLSSVDHWIIDIKDMNGDIYRTYTGKTNEQVLRNLRVLADAKADCIIRIPQIPEYNTPDDVKASIAHIRKMGFTNINVFTYKKKSYGQ